MGMEISGIVKGLLQIKANLKAESSGKETEQDFTAGFMELMNQNSLPNMNAAVDLRQMQFDVNKANTVNTAYDTYSSSVKTVEVQNPTAPEEIQTEAEDFLQAYEEEIRSILKEELGVTDEEISAALEALDMNILDVRNLQDLAALVQELTGKDIGTLFSSEAFQNVMEQAAAETETLCAALGVTKEEWNVLCEAWEQADTMTAPETEPAAEIMDEQPAQTNFAVQNRPLEETAVNAALVKEQTETSELKEEDAAAVSDLDRSLEEGKSTDKITVDIKEETETSSKEEQSLMDHSKNSGKEPAHTDNLLTGTQNIRTEEFVLPKEIVQPYTGQVNAFDLIDQIARNVRVTISAAETSMEMQLNPENLGRLYLNISEREGIIRAQITAQNTAVKEALEIQIAELRQSLNQQGIKVDAIEVTVGTHEFEQNLEENARGEEQAKQQMQESDKRTRRNLNVNDLEGLTGLMSEEEQLAAQIMKDNGNQVDLTA